MELTQAVKFLNLEEALREAHEYGATGRPLPSVEPARLTELWGRTSVKRDMDLAYLHKGGAPTLIFGPHSMWSSGRIEVCDRQTGKSFQASFTPTFYGDCWGLCFPGNGILICYTELTVKGIYTVTNKGELYVYNFMAETIIMPPDTAFGQSFCVLMEDTKGFDFRPGEGATPSDNVKFVMEMAIITANCEA